MPITSGAIKKGNAVALDFPPILGRVVNVNRNRTAFLVDFGEFVKWFPVRRLKLVHQSLPYELRGFQPAPAAAYTELGGLPNPGNSTSTTPVEDQAEFPGF